MVDNPSEESPVSAPTGPKPKSAIVVFATSSTGRLILGGVALFVVLVVLGALAFFFLLNTGDQPSVPVATPGGSKPATAAVAPTNPPEQPLDETFTFRNVFAPSVNPPAEPSTTSGTSGGTTSTSATATVPAGPKDTLILTKISTESGVRVATFQWNGAEYVVEEGDQVADSPWKVVTIQSDSVVMLYGDSRVTLTVGQGFSDGGVVVSK
jgi:hypothetical protein